MKYVSLIIATISVMGLSACGQSKKNVPEKVKQAFSEKFTDVKNVKWNKENDQIWEAEFKMNGKEYSANFDLEGNWEETEYEINFDDIDPAVKSTLGNEFKDCKISKAEISETKNGKVYEFEMKKGKDITEVAVDLNGKVIKKDAEKKDNGGEEDDD